MSEAGRPRAEPDQALVFRALSDPSRREILDQLFARDGQTLAELTGYLPEMTRFGVMKHLRLLEAAGLVTTRRSGREKLHYLNPVPIRLVLDRWLTKYARPKVDALISLKQELEMESTAVANPVFVLQTFIRTTPERLWQAITTPEFTERYFFGAAVRSDWMPGSPVSYDNPDGTAVISGTVLEAQPPRRLVMSFRSHFDAESVGEEPSRVTWEIERTGEVCKLTVMHDGFDGETATYRRISDGGWSWVLSNLKTLLEVGQPLG